MSRQIFPPLYILAVLPSSSGSSISIGVAGYVAGISNWTLNVNFVCSYMHQQDPSHLTPESSVGCTSNQSLSLAVFASTNSMRAISSSLSRSCQSGSIGPALILNDGKESLDICCNVMSNVTQNFFPTVGGFVGPITIPVI